MSESDTNTPTSHTSPTAIAPDAQHMHKELMATLTSLIADAAPVSSNTKMRTRNRKNRAAKKKAKNCNAVVSEKVICVNPHETSSDPSNGLLPWLTHVMSRSALMSSRTKKNPTNSTKKLLRCRKRLGKEQKRCKKLKKIVKSLKTELKSTKEALRKVTKKLAKK